jgi:hypothetical protein
MLGSSNVLVEFGYRCFRVDLFSNDVFRVLSLRFSEACAKAKKYSSSLQGEEGDRWLTMEWIVGGTSRGIVVSIATAKKVRIPFSDCVWLAKESIVVHVYEGIHSIFPVFRLFLYKILCMYTMCVQ